MQEIVLAAAARNDAILRFVTSAAIQRFSRGTLTAGAAVWGVSVAVAFLPILRRSASPGQLPGLMTSAGLDARGPFLLVVLIPLLAVLGGFIGRLLSNRFDASSQQWAFRASCIAFFVAPWIPLSGGGVLLSLVPLVAAVSFTCLRSYSALWTASDCLLVPAFLAANLATLEIFIQLEPVASALLAAALVIAVRLLVCLRRHRQYPPALTFVAGPLAFVAEWRITAGDHPGDAAAALLIVCVVPFLIRSLPIRERAFTVPRWVAYPLALLLYSHIMVGFSTPVLNLFEHGFGLINASEMLRGEALYRDVLPTHGPLSDGVIDWLGMRIGGANLGAALIARYLVALLAPLALYAVALAMSGSPELSFVAVLGSISLSPAPVTALAELSSLMFLRAVPSLFALALIALALRRRSKRSLAAGASLAAVAWLTSLDFGAFALAVIPLAALRFSRRWSERAHALLWAAGGIAAVAAPVALYFAANGLLISYLRSTFLEVPALSSAYNMGFATLADCCNGSVPFPELLPLALADPKVFPFVAWAVVVVAFATALVPSPLGASRRTGPLLIVAAWIIVCGISFAERKHLYFHLLLPPLFAATAWQVARDRSAPDAETRHWRRVIAAAITIVVVATTHLGLHVSEAMPSAVRNREQIVERDLTFYRALPRARGALLRKEDVARLEIVRAFLERELPNRSDTFFNFTNLPVLYFLFDRRVPIRLAEVPMYEPISVQKEIVATLERDRSVRFALVSFPYWSQRIDGVPNEVRAPLVWAYLVRHFEVAFVSNGAVFMKRKDRVIPRYVY